MPVAEHMFQTLDSFPRTEACSPLSNPDFPSVPEVRRGTIEGKDPLGFPLLIFFAAFIFILAVSILKMFSCAICVGMCCYI